MSLVVIFLIIGSLGPTCVNLHNESHSASPTLSGHNTTLSDKAITVKTQANDNVQQLWPAANRTDIKIFREGPLIIARQYWYPVLEIGLKKHQPTSPAFTTATTPTLSNTAQPFTTNTRTITAEPPTSNTAKTTISIRPNPVIHTNTTNGKTTSRASAEPLSNPSPNTTNMPQDTIIPTQTSVTTDTFKQHTTTASSTSLPSTEGGLQDFKTTTVTGTTAKRTFSPTSPSSYSHPPHILIPTFKPGSTKATTTAITERAEKTSSPSVDTTATETTQLDKTEMVNTEITPLQGATGTWIKTTTSNFSTMDIRTATTIQAKSGTVSEALTLATESPQVTTKSSTTKTESTTRPLEGPTTNIRETPKPVTQSDSSSASTAYITQNESKRAKTNAFNTANVPETSTATAVINKQETSTPKSTAVQGSSTVINTESATVAIRTTGTLSQDLTLIPQTTTKPLPAKTESTAETSIKTSTLAGPITVSRVTQEPATQPDSSSASTAHTKHTTLKESTTVTTSDQGLSSVINSQSTTVDVRSTTTGQANVTLPKDLSMAPDTPYVTPKSSPDETQSTTTSKPVTAAQTFKGPTTVISVTQEPATPSDSSSVSTAHTTLEESKTAKTSALNTANVLETSTATTFIKKQETNTTVSTSSQGSSSVITSESVTADIRTTTSPFPPKSESTTENSTRPVTDVPTLERSTTVIRVTQEPATQSDSTSASTAHTTHTTQKESTTKTTSTQGLSSVISSQPATVDIRTTTTGQGNVTLPKELSVAPETPYVTPKSSPDKTQSTTTSKPVTVAQTFKGPTTVIRVTQEPATQADAGASSTAITGLTKVATLPENVTMVSKTSVVKSTSTTVIDVRETSTTKTNLADGSSSTIKSTANVTRTTTTTTDLVPEKPHNITITPASTNRTTTAPPSTFLKSASPTKQTLKSTKNTTSDATTLSQTVKSTNSFKINASLPSTTPAPPDRRETTLLKPPETTMFPTHPPVLDEGSIGLQFSLNETFDIALSDRTTYEFYFLATKVVIAINKLYKAAFKEFKRSRVNSFAKGSIKVNMTLVYENTTVVPSAVKVEEVLYKAVLISDIPLNIVNDTIKAEPKETPNKDTFTTTAPQTTITTATSTEYINTTSAASAWTLHYLIMTITAVITVFVNCFLV